MVYSLSKKWTFFVNFVDAYSIPKLILGFQSKEEKMSHRTFPFITTGMQEPTHFVPRYACLVKGSVKAFTKLQGERIHCIFGHLWVTFEGDTKDHVLAAGEHLEILNGGKVLLSGPGCYRISISDVDGLDLAVAS
jgi:Protein of unknown function (DUF2917)